MTAYNIQSSVEGEVTGSGNHSYLLVMVLIESNGSMITIFEMSRKMKVSDL